MSSYNKGYKAYEEGYPSTHWFYDLPPGTDGFSNDVAEWHRGWRDAEERENSALEITQEDLDDLWEAICNE